MISSLTSTRMFVVLLATVMLSHFAHSQLMPAPMGVCFLQNSTLAMAQSFCRLASVPECVEGDGKESSQFQCYMRCSHPTQQDQKLYNCTEYDMECFDGVTCILPPKRMKEEEDGYLRG